jgi:hypothetical protein
MVPTRGRDRLAFAITASNLVPLFQLAGVIPLAIKTVAGGGLAGAAAGSVLQAPGIWRFAGALHLQAMPGVASLRSRIRRRQASAQQGWPSSGRKGCISHANNQA